MDASEHENSRKKADRTFFLILLPFFVYLGYCIGLFPVRHVTLDNLSDGVLDVLLHPFSFRSIGLDDQNHRGKPADLVRPVPEGSRT